MERKTIRGDIPSKLYFCADTAKNLCSKLYFCGHKTTRARHVGVNTTNEVLIIYKYTMAVILYFPLGS